MPVFPETPDYPIAESLFFKTLKSEMENGFAQVRSVWSKPLRKWELTFNNREQGVFENIRDFFISRKGSFDAFAWENPNDGQTYTVRFEADGLKVQKSGHDRFNITLKFVEVK